MVIHLCNKLACMHLTDWWELSSQIDIADSTFHDSGHFENARVARNWHSKTSEATVATGLTDGIWLVQFRDTLVCVYVCLHQLVETLRAKAPTDPLLCVYTYVMNLYNITYIHMFSVYLLLCVCICASMTWHMRMHMHITLSEFVLCMHFMYCREMRVVVQYA